MKIKKINSVFLALLIINFSSHSIASQANANKTEPSIVMPALVASIGLFGGYIAYSWYKQDAQKTKAEIEQPVLRDYVPVQDRDDLIALFNANNNHLGATWDYKKARNNKRTVKIIDGKERLMGFIMYRYEEGLKRGIIDYMAVDSQYRRKGHGKKLVQSALEEFKKRGAENALLSVKKDDAATVHFYTQCGFRINPENVQPHLKWMTVSFK